MVVHTSEHADDELPLGAVSGVPAEDAERLLARAGSQLAPKFLDFYPAIVWEDQDECLEVRPENVRT